MKTLKVLIAEDHFELREHLSDLIKSLGWQVETAGDGLEAMRKVDGSFDVIITDGQMPRMDGIGLTASLRGKGITCPIIMLSGSPELMPEFYARGGNMFIDKPNFKAIKIALDRYREKETA